MIVIMFEMDQCTVPIMDKFRSGPQDVHILELQQNYIDKKICIMAFLLIWVIYYYLCFSKHQ